MLKKISERMSTPRRGFEIRVIEWDNRERRVELQQNIVDDEGDEQCAAIILDATEAERVMHFLREALL